MTFSLYPSVKRGSSRDKAGIEPDSPQLKELKQKVLQKNKYICQADGCGAVLSIDNAEIHNLDDCHDNLSFDNLAILCSLCHAWNHIGLLGKNGTLFLAGGGEENVIMPAEINALMLACAVVLNAEHDAENFSKLRAVVDMLLNNIETSNADVTKAWGGATLKDISSALSRAADEVYQSRKESMMGLGIAINPHVLGFKAKKVLLPNGEFGNLNLFEQWEVLYKQYITSADDEINNTVVPDEAIALEKMKNNGVKGVNGQWQD